MTADGEVRTEDEDRARFIGSLYEGPQPSPGAAAEPASESDNEILDGVERKMPRRGSAIWEKTPKGLARLIVYEREATASKEPQFGLKVGCFCTPLDDLGVTYGKPNLDLGENLASGGPLPVEFLDRMDTWSYAKAELAQWLDRHRRMHQDQIQLVIKDDTRYRIPWELLWVPSLAESGLADGYLGAVLTVTRWVRVKSFWPPFVKPVTGLYQAEGPVVAYVDPDMLHDRELLRELHFDVDHAENMRELFHKLRDGSKDLALVYVASHGEFDDDSGGCVLGGLSIGQAGKFNDDLPRLRNPATLVFLNGCRTGSYGIDTRTYNDGALRGFALVFLRAGAAGVLATTGAVGNKEAGELAEALFRLISADRSVTVAEAVRRLRAVAAEKIARLLDAGNPQDADNELILSLIYPFMYVYFGSPELLVSVATRDDSGGQGEPGAGNGVT